MNDSDRRARSGMAGAEKLRARSMSPIRGTHVPKGSDAFREAMEQVYTDMREQRKQERVNSEEKDDEDYSDEERDKCMDIDLFRRFSVTEHAAKLNPLKRGGRHIFGNKNLPRPDERVTRRRHSIATSVFYEPSKKASSVH